MKPTLEQIYTSLFEGYGPQGWWPLINLDPVEKTGVISGYHPGDYSLPKTKKQIFEICLGAILTQNTGWVQVNKALWNLQKEEILLPEKILQIEITKLGDLIKPAGYFNQKAKKVKIFTDFFLQLATDKTPSRQELLCLWGIGPETADSILLYAYKIPTFVIDAYTRRIFSHLGFFDTKSSYDEIKNLFENNLPNDFIIFQEYHALIVEHAKKFYHRSANYEKCFLFQKIKNCKGRLLGTF